MPVPVSIEPVERPLLCCRVRQAPIRTRNTTTGGRHFKQSVSADVTKSVLGAGAKIDVRDSYGNTPLSMAVFASGGNGAVIKLLRNAGVDPYVANSSGVSLLSLARTIANYYVAQFFSDLPPSPS